MGMPSVRTFTDHKTRRIYADMKALEEARQELHRSYYERMMHRGALFPDEDSCNTDEVNEKEELLLLI